VYWAVRQPFWHSTSDSLTFICKGFTPDKGDWGRRQGTCGMWYHNIHNRSVDTSAPDSGVHDLYKKIARIFPSFISGR